MPQQTHAQARVVDPVLTTVAQGYSNNELIASSLFPIVPVGLRGGQVIQFGKEDFMLYSTARAPGESTRRVKFGYSGSPYALVDYSLEGQVPIELLQEGMNGPGIDHGRRAVNGVQNIMALRREKASADLARNLANYGTNNKTTLSGTSQWNDFTGTSNPVNNVENAKEAVRAATGKRPNTVALGAAVMAKIKQHPVILDRIKYTGRDVATPELLAALFGVERVLVGDAIYADDAGNFLDVWGKDVVVAYTNLAPVPEQGAPSFGYTYQLDGYPLVEETYYDRNAKSWIYPVTTAEAPVIASALGGYLIKNAVA